MINGTVLPFAGQMPKLEEDVFVAHGAIVIGMTTLQKGSNIWYNSVIRGDREPIVIGSYTNVQDNCTIHTTIGQVPTIIGQYVSIGHGCVLHGCIIHDYCLIGMNATVMDNAEIGEGSIVGSGAVITAGTKIPPYSVVMGTPGKVVKTLDPASSLDSRKKQALRYYKLAHKHIESIGTLGR